MISESELNQRRPEVNDKIFYQKHRFNQLGLGRAPHAAMNMSGWTDSLRLTLLQKTKSNAQKRRSGLSIGSWDLRSCNSESKLRQIVEQLSDRDFDIAVLTEAKAETCVREIDRSRFLKFSSLTHRRDDKIG